MQSAVIIKCHSNPSKTEDDNMTHHFNRRTVLGISAALIVATLPAFPALAQIKQVLRISTPAVPDDWHAKMWTVLKDELDKTAPGPV